MDWVGNVASGVAVLLLVLREFRLGAGAATDRLVKTLNETITAQAQRITALETTVSRLMTENAELRATVNTLMHLQTNGTNGGATRKCERTVRTRAGARMREVEREE